MKIKPVNEGKSISVPSTVLSKLQDCNANELKVLISVLAEPDFDADKLSEKLDITKRSLNSALSFWEKAGVIETGNVSVKGRAKSTATEVPHYSMDQTAELLEAGGEKLNEFLHICMNIQHTTFSKSYIEKLVNLMDYLKLEWDYVILLYTHCSKIFDKPVSIRYIENLAISLHDNGIVEYEALDAHLTAIENAKSAEGKLRKLFGIGTRALTAKEKKNFAAWTGEWKMSFEMIEKAYEVTVDATNGNASVSYCNAVLKRWYEAGYTDVETVNASMEQYRLDKEAAKKSDSSFDTDDFFEAALKRSFGDELYGQMKGE